MLHLLTHSYLLTASRRPSGCSTLQWRSSASRWAVSPPSLRSPHRWGVPPGLSNRSLARGTVVREHAVRPSPHLHRTLVPSLLSHVAGRASEHHRRGAGRAGFDEGHHGGRGAHVLRKARTGPWGSMSTAIRAAPAHPCNGAASQRAPCSLSGRHDGSAALLAAPWRPSDRRLPPH